MTNITPNDESIASAPNFIREIWISLNPRQRALACLLPTASSKEQAMIDAGFAASTARKKSGALPSGVAEVAAYIAGTAVKSAVMSIDEVLGELSHAVRFDPIDIFDDNDCLKPVRKWPAAARRALASLETNELFEGSGKDRVMTGYARKVKLVGKVEAAAQLLRALGAFAPEKIEHTHRIEGLGGLLAELASTGADTGPGPAASRR